MMKLEEIIDREPGLVSQRLTGRHPAPRLCRCRFKSTEALVRTCRTLNNTNGDGREVDLQPSLARLNPKKSRRPS